MFFVISTKIKRQTRVSFVDFVPRYSLTNIEWWIIIHICLNKIYTFLTFFEVCLTCFCNFASDNLQKAPYLTIKKARLTPRIYGPSVGRQLYFLSFIRELLKGAWGKRSVSLAKYFRSNGTLRCSSATGFPHTFFALILLVVSPLYNTAYHARSP